MLRHLWTECFGESCIDVSICQNSKTIAIADAGGKFILANIDDGTIIFDFNTEMPAWGVAHKLKANGKWLSAIACASKTPTSGKLIILEDDQVVAEFKLPAPAWDVTILDTPEKVIATSWDGTIYHWTPEDPSNIRKTEILLENPLFGIANKKNNNILISVERNGIFEIERNSNSSKIIVKSKSNVYNIAISDDEQAIAYCNYTPKVTVFNKNTATSIKFDAGPCYACTFADSLLLTGNTNGTISIWSEKMVSEPLFSFEIGSPVWSLVYNKALSTILIATGDGRILCYELTIQEPQTTDIIEMLIKIKEGHQVSLVDIILQYQCLDMFVSHIFAVLNDTEVDDKKNGAIAVESCISSIDKKQLTDAHIIIEAITLACLGRHQEACARLQSLEIGSPWYAMSIALLIQNLLSLDKIDAARRVFAANSAIPGLSRLIDYERLIPPTLSSDIPSTKPDAHQVIGTIGQDLAERSVTILTKPTKKSIKSEHIPYDLVKFIKYEYPSDADHAKKILEHNQVQYILLNHNKPEYNHPMSLDIGCATCRYPLWFESQGYFATGYDISDSAIEICSKRAFGHENIRIEKKDILKDNAEINKYDVITCMMGTFNHFSRDLQNTAINWCFESLKPGGIFIFSSWNKDCSFNTLLQFYNSDERKELLNNLQNFNELKGMLEDHDFMVEHIRPAAFLPDECYNTWLRSYGEFTIINLDEQLGKILNPSEAQLAIFGAIKL